MTTYKVYWTESGKIDGTDFNENEMPEALKYSEQLRTLQRDGADISHIVMACENTDMVGHQGVDVVKADYEWLKRRIIGTGRKVT